MGKFTSIDKRPPEGNSYPTGAPDGALKNQRGAGINPLMPSWAGAKLEELPVYVTVIVDTVVNRVVTETASKNRRR